MQSTYRHLIFFTILSVFPALSVLGQNFTKDFSLPEGVTVSIHNRYGRVDVEALAVEKDAERKGELAAASDAAVTVKEIVFGGKGRRIEIEVTPSDPKKRIDIGLKVPERSLVAVETLDGAVMVTGDLALIDVTSVTGTVAVDIPVNDLKYNLLWTESHPRLVSDIELKKIKEKSAGRFLISGELHSSTAAVEPSSDDPPADTGETLTEDAGAPKKRKKARKNSVGIDLRFTSARGIFLLNVPPNEVSSDLRERPLTNAAKAIIRSGDTFLMDAIRRSSPKYFGDYLRTLPPMKRQPSFAERGQSFEVPAAAEKRVLLRVLDASNRSVSGLEANDFEVFENGEPQEIVSVRRATAPVNLVLLLDVSGSVENYVTFIRKAARSFVNTVDRSDRISIVIFNDDVKQVAGFTTDKAELSKSLDTFDAGGATAYYDALAYTLSETLRPLKGERTAIVVLTDGDDNRSFLAFDSLAGSIQESGALIYPLYVPSGLVASAAADPNSTVDPLRAKYMGLTTKAEGEGERLAKVSGGTYYPISQLSQIQSAYDDIVEQLRTAYVVTYRSNIPNAHPKLKIRAKREATTVTITNVTAGQ